MNHYVENEHCDGENTCRECGSTDYHSPSCSLDDRTHCDDCGEPCDSPHGNRDRALFCCECAYALAYVPFDRCELCAERHSALAR